MRTDLQKVGGVAALIEAAVYVFGFGLFVVVLDSSEFVGPAEQIALLTEAHTVLYVANLLIYVVFGACLVVLTLALHERLKSGAPAIMQVASAFGLIWAGLVIASGMIANIGMSSVVELAVTEPEQAASLWVAVGTLQEALGGGNEVTGGLWVALLSWAALRSGRLHNALNYLGLAVGLAGVLTMIPDAEAFAAVFGMGQIVWFAWVGGVMLRRPLEAV